MDCGIVQNLSDKPIRDVELRWQTAPGAPPAHADESQIVGNVPPLSRRGFVRPDSLAAWNQNDLALLVQFMDANGVPWWLRNDNTLEEVVSIA